MKICVYTISDLKKESIECINMLYDSIFSQRINQNKNIDFYVVGNKQDYSNFHYNYILSEYTDYHIVYSRYTKNLPDGYDSYIYLDSDILFFDSILSLVDDAPYGIVLEDCSNMDSLWFKYPFAPEEDTKFLKKTTAINSGTFVISDKKNLENISKLFFPYLDLWKTKTDAENAILEQSSFNYYVYKTCGTSFEKCNILSDKIQLGCTDEFSISHKKIYHFTNFNLGMQKKLEYMQKFKSIYEEYTQ